MRGDTMDKLIKYLSKTPYFKELLTKFNSNEELQITNTNDSISLLMLIFLFKNLDKNILVVTPVISRITYSVYLISSSISAGV